MFISRSHNFYSVLLCLFLTQLGYSQTDHQSQLDTLAELTDRVEATNYILKIEEFLPLPIRDSVVAIAIINAETSNIDSLLFHALTAGFLVDRAQEDYDKAKVKINKALKISENLADDVLYYSTLNNIGGLHQFASEYESADSIFTVCIDFWHSVNDTIKLSKGYNNKAVIYMRRSRFDEADSLIQIAKMYGVASGPRVLTSAMNTELVIAAYSGKMKKAYEVSNQILKTIEPVAEKYLPFYANCLLNNGSIATSLELNNNAMTSLLKADSVLQVIKHDKGQISVLENIGSLYDVMGDHELAVEYIKKALKLSRTQNDPVTMAQVMERLANYINNKADLKDVSYSKSLIDSAFQIFEEREMSVEMGSCFNSLGNIFAWENKMDSALINFDKSIAIFEAEGFDELVGGPYFSKAEILVSQDKFTEALSYLNKIDPDSYEVERYLVEYNYLKGKVLSKTGNATAANALLLEAYDKNTELVEASQAAEIKEIGDKYQADKQIAISEKLKAEQVVKELTISKQKSILGYGGLGLGLVSLLSFLLFRQSRKRQLLNKDLQQQKSQVLLLNQELNHRVKNNLSFMTTLLEMQGRRTDSEETRQALQESEGRLKALSLVHANLFKNESDTHINLKDYLQEILGHLQEVFGAGQKALSINSSFMDRVVDAEDAMRIGLILNELVTNSVKHAFAQVDNPRIDIETIKEGDKIVLKYKDNGPGIQKAQIGQDPRKQSLGVKLIGILERQVSEVVRLEVG